MNTDQEFFLPRICADDCGLKIKSFHRRGRKGRRGRLALTVVASNGEDVLQKIHDDLRFVICGAIQLRFSSIGMLSPSQRNTTTAFRQCQRRMDMGISCRQRAAKWKKE